MRFHPLSISPALRNRNVMLFLFSTPFTWVAVSLAWFSFPFLVKAFVIDGEATTLGRIGAIATYVSLAAFFVTATISDRYRRDVMIWVGLIPYILGLWIFSTARTVSDVLLGQVLTSMAWGLSGPAQNALLADSTPVEARNLVYGWQFWLRNVSFGGGNVIGYFLFQAAGSEINVALLHLAMRIGLVLMCSGGLTVLFVRDSYRIPAEEDHTLGVDQKVDHVRGFTRHGLYIVITLIVSSSIILGFGAGLSIPFFPYFFNEIYAVNLATLSLIFAVMQILTGFLGKWLTDLGTKHGRVRMIFLSQMIAVVLLYALVSYPPLTVAIIAMLTRSAAMNAAGPLTQVMMMDYSPRAKRASITTIAYVSWTIVNGIAQVLGGMLIDARGYSFAFFATATTYLIATVWIATIRERKSRA